MLGAHLEENPYNTYACMEFKKCIPCQRQKHALAYNYLF